METKKIDLFEVVTKKVIDQLETGTIPWRKSWTGGTGAINYVSRKRYDGINILLLPFEGEYLSFKQVKEAGGYIKKDEKAHQIIFWKWLEYEKENANGEKEIKRTPLLKYYNVFHISQCVKIESKIIPIQINNQIEQANNLITAYTKREKLIIKSIKGAERCYYSPSKDFISMPNISQFECSEEYYSTLFHECIHSTGHKSRLNRFETLADAAAHSESYSKEELIAEMGAAFINNIVGIDTDALAMNSAAYIKGWLSTIKNNNNKFIIEAAGKAKAAVKFIISENQTETITTKS